MKRLSKHFASDLNCISSDAGFYSIKPFDHDLILFKESGGGYKFDASSLSVIGGRSQRPFKSTRLGDLLGLCEADKRFLTDFLFDSSRKYAFFISDGKPLMIFNTLFRSSALGVAFVFDYPSSTMISAMKNGDLEIFGERIYSPSLFDAAASGISVGLDHSGFTHSIFSITDTLSAMLGEGNDLFEIKSCLTAAEELIGCSISFNVSDLSSLALSDLHSTAALLLCLFSICRRISTDRGAEVYIDSAREHVKYNVSFETLNDTLTELERECVGFCSDLAQGLEMPMSIELSNRSFSAEFVPYRVDPSLYGLKAGVNIKFNCED